MIDYSLKAIGIAKITVASNGNEAMYKIKIAPKPFDLIICDWMMPEMNGLEFLQKVRSIKYPSKFLMLTGKATKEFVTEAVNAGADSYIVKPFTVEDLRKRVKSITKDMIQ